MMGIELKVRESLRIAGEEGDAKSAEVFPCLR